jgi:ribonuclease HI
LKTNQTLLLISIFHTTKNLSQSTQVTRRSSQTVLKKGSAVSAAAVTKGTVLVSRLPNHASIFSAESRAVLLALNIIEQATCNHFLILSDSLSCLKAIENRKVQNPLILEILAFLHQLLRLDYCITFVWVPSHVGIAENTAADATAKAALCLQVSNSKVPYSDFKPMITAHANKLWQHSWDTETNNKLHKVQPIIKPSILYKLSRRDEVIIHRLRIGHTHLTHSYLLKRELPPVCESCNIPLTVEHILLYCSNHAVVRKRFFDCNSIEDVFNCIRYHVIVNYIKEIGFYRRL